MIFTKQRSILLSAIAFTAVVSYNLGRLQQPTAISLATHEGPAINSPKESDTPWLKPTLRSNNSAKANDAAVEVEFDLKKALLPLKKLRGSDRLNYIDDLFTYLATTHTPSEALELAASLDGDQDYAHRILICEWHLANKTLPIGQENAFRRRIMALSDGPFGIEVELSKQISQLNLSDDVKEAWKENLSDHTSRSHIQGILDSKTIVSNPEKLLQSDSEWTNWETSNYRNIVMENWAQRDPKNALNWALENSVTLGENYSETVLAQWAKINPNDLAKYAKGIEDYDLRQSAIKAAASALAYSNTTQAVAWADSISDSYEREIAYETIYNSSIKGIGARIESDNGLPQIKNILANGPLVDSGIQVGDRIVETIEPDGTTYALYGEDLQNVIETLGGEPDSFVKLRVLREDPDSNSFEEIVIETKRDLLIIDRSKKY